MAIKPILFSGPMVRAILAGNKTQTRRVVKLDVARDNRFPIGPHTVMNIRDPKAVEYAPYRKGDVLWVRETWREHRGTDECGCGGDICLCPPEGTPIFRADMDDGESVWRPSIFMPKKHCRIFLKIVGVRTEWLRDLSHEDALSEGIIEQPGGFAVENPDGGWIRTVDPVQTFSTLWDVLNYKRGFGWDVSPWVWVYEFERTERPADWPGIDSSETF